jgi:hypothetical protein
MRKFILFGAATTMLLAGAVAWTTSSHSAIEASVGTTQIDPLSMMANAKNLPSQESLNLKMWPDNGVAVTDFVSGAEAL